MIYDQKSYWEKIYENKELQFPLYDGWLDEHLNLLASKQHIVDLGCGNGVNTVFLAQNSIRAVACDFSTYALEQLVSILPDIFVLQFDMTKGLPFLHDSIDVFIADLSLHYFSFADTQQIFADIKRSLKPNGIIIFRANAYDSNYDYSKYDQLEQDFFLIDGCTKRFFTLEKTRAFF